MPEVGAAVLKARYIRGITTGAALASSAFGTAGRVYLVPIDILWPITIDRIIYQVGGTSAGNVRLGIYREGATADSPAGAALVVESASVAQATASYMQMVTVGDTLFTPGQYFIGMQGSNTTGTFTRTADLALLLAWFYDRAGGYGVFTTPCPALSAPGIAPFFMLRIKENLPAGQRL